MGLSTAFLGIGSALVPIGVQKQKEANQLDPQTEFTLVEDPGCNITEVVFVKSNQEWCEKKINGRNQQVKCGCEDMYVYNFAAPQLVNVSSFYIDTGDNYVYQSIEDFINGQRDDCNSGSRALPRYSLGEQTECWRPSEPGGEIPGSYRCGNEECIKLFDPVYDAEAADIQAKELWIFGTVLLSLTIPACCVAGYLKFKIPGRAPTTSAFPSPIFP